MASAASRTDGASGSTPSRSQARQRSPTTPDKPKKKKMRPADFPGDFTGAADNSVLNWLAGAVRTLRQKMPLLDERISACEVKVGQLREARDEAEDELLDTRIENIVADYVKVGLRKESRDEAKEELDLRIENIVADDVSLQHTNIKDIFRDTSKRIDGLRDEFGDYTAKVDDMLEPLEQRVEILERDCRANASALRAADRPGTKPGPSPESSMQAASRTTHAKFDPVMVERFVQAMLASMAGTGRRQRENYLKTLQKNARQVSSDKHRADAEEVCRRLTELISTW